MAEEKSLLEFLDSSQLNCLNEHSDHGIKAILSSKSKNTTDAYLLSDADEQLLFTIPFNQTVRVKSILIQTSAEHAAQAPKTVKIVINRDSVGFEDVEDAGEGEVAQLLDLTEAQVTGGQRIALRFVRFQNVSSLHIFVASNQGGEDETRIDAIDVFGMSVETTRDLSGLKNQSEEG